MGKLNLNSDAIAEIFKRYCHGKGYQVEDKKDSNNDWRLTISNMQDRFVVNIYHTGKILIQGKNSSLKTEFDQFKQKFEANPRDFLGSEVQEMRGCQTIYDILLSDLRISIRESLKDLYVMLEITEDPKADIEYRAKIARNDFSLTMTQFKTGTLLLQGKTDRLFDEICDCIEKIANPAEKQVIARFISSDEKNLEIFAAKYSPRLLEVAEESTKKKLGDVYEYVENHDQKWFVASECLCLSKISLPEFSPLVMPASKAFEGFAKKLLTDLNLVVKDYFEKKGSNFGILSDKSNPKRQDFCKKHKYNEQFIDRLKSSLDMNRHFMMHSDNSKVTKVDSAEDGEEKVATVFKDAKEIFEYFNDLYRLLTT